MRMSTRPLVRYSHAWRCFTTVGFKVPGYRHLAHTEATAEPPASSPQSQPPQKSQPLSYTPDVPLPQLKDCFSSLPAFFHPDDYNSTSRSTSDPGLLGASEVSEKPSPQKEYRPTPLPVAPDKTLYGKWRFLLEDNAKARQEIDGRVISGETLLIDDPQWKNDIALWTCLLDISCRWGRRKGALKILKLFLNRQPDISLDGPLADFFWTSMTAVAVDDSDVLEETCRVAKRLAQDQEAQWPRLYHTTVSHFLRNERWAEAVQWHHNLFKEHSPNMEEFASMICLFASKANKLCHSALQSIYSHSHFRNLYDRVIPRVHRRGLYWAALSWRSVLLTYHDRPKSAVSGPFIRYLHRHYPDEALCEEELIVSHPDFKQWCIVPKATEEATAAVKTTPTIPASGEPPPNDGLIARWFASEWSNLDFSMTVIHRLGVQQIGPLSLQALGLRCTTAQELLDRLQTLKNLGIKPTEGNYATVIQKLIQQRDDENLFSVLKSDVHPDVFENLQTIRSIAAASAQDTDWKRYRTFTNVLGILQKDQASNLYIEALKRCFKHPKRWAFALRLLHDAIAADVRLPSSTFTPFFKALNYDFLKRSCLGFRSHTDDAFALLYLALDRNCGIPTWIWSSILGSLARDRRFDAIESVSRQLLTYYHRHRQQGRPIRIHPSDAAFRNQAQIAKGYKTTLPGNTPLSNSNHPCRLIFNEKVIMNILIGGFRSPLSKGTYDPSSTITAPTNTPKEYGPAGGIRLLRTLVDLGFPISEEFIKSALIYAVLDWRPKPWRMEYTDLLTLPWRTHTLEDVKLLCDSAWGSPITPTINTFKTAVEEARAQVVQLKRDQIAGHQSMMRSVFKGRPPMSEIYSNSHIGYQSTEQDLCSTEWEVKQSRNT